MPARADVFDLSSLILDRGEARRIDLEVAIEPLRYGAQDYAPTDGTVPVRLDVSRTTAGGYALRLGYEVQLGGPCARCLENAGTELKIDAREIDQPGGGEELSSPYLEDEELDLKAWARDALALALPARILCTDDCLGLCPECGEDLNHAAQGHRHERAPDPRWAKLGELSFE